MQRFDQTVHRALWLLGLTLLCFGAPAFAAGRDPFAGKPDLFGIWLGVGVDAKPPYRNSPWPSLEFTAWGAAESKRLTVPETPDECAPYGPLAYMGGGSLFPLEIAKTTTGLLIMYEPSPVPRRVYLDGRKHPDELDPTWLGHSVAHWEGDTLVIDTVGLNGRSRPLNGYLAGAVNSKTDTAPRLPVSDGLHLVERIRLVSGGEYLEDEMTIADLKTYTRPFTVKHYWQRRPDLDVLEYYCDDNRKPQSEGHAESTP